MRFSLRWLLLFVAFVALGVASLRYASQLLSDCLSSGYLGLLLVAVIGMAYRRERQRAFWFGCCVFGWPFVVYLHFMSAETTVDHLIGAVYDYATWTVTVDQATAIAHNESGGFYRQSTTGYIASFPRYLPFRSSGRSLVGITIAVFGGLIAQWFYATCDRPVKPCVS